jgi:hypothetical protein
MRGTVGECSVEHCSGDLAGMHRGDAAAGTEWSEVDFVAKGLGGFYGRYDVRTWFALDKRFDGELEQQHATEL